MDLSVSYLTLIMGNDNIDSSFFGDLAQLVEHTAHIRDVNGSIPLVAIKASDFGGLFLFIHCGAIMLFAPQKERVKALSAARLDRSYLNCAPGIVARASAASAAVSSSL